MNIAQEFEQVKELYDKAKEELGNKVKELFKNYAHELFLDRVVSVGFVAYTPYWNDGDVCNYEVHSYPDDIRINGCSLDELDGNDVELHIDVNYKIAEQISQKFSSILDKIPSEIIESTFGEGLHMFHSDGTFTTEGYEHD